MSHVSETRLVPLRIVVHPERNNIITIRRLTEIRARHIIGLFRPTAAQAPSRRPRRLYAVMRARIYMNTCCAATAVVVVVNPLGDDMICRFPMEIC